MFCYGVRWFAGRHDGMVGCSGMIDRWMDGEGWRVRERQREGAEEDCESQWQVYKGLHPAESAFFDLKWRESFL